MIDLTLPGLSAELSRIQKEIRLWDIQRESSLYQKNREIVMGAYRGPSCVAAREAVEKSFRKATEMVELLRIQYMAVLAAFTVMTEYDIARRKKAPDSHVGGYLTSLAYDCNDVNLRRAVIARKHNFFPVKEEKAETVWGHLPIGG